VSVRSGVLVALAFGACERCGEAIADKRLDALPFARYCITCQRAIEEEERMATG